MAQKDSRYSLERRIARAAKRNNWREVKHLMAAAGTVLINPKESLLQQAVFSQPPCSR
jgi:hypothetical protein